MAAGTAAGRRNPRDTSRRVAFATWVGWGNVGVAYFAPDERV